jgi:hypothetical protein
VFDGVGQFLLDQRAGGLQAGDAAVQVGELAAQHLDRAGALRARRAARAQAFHERAGVLEVEADLEQGADLADQAQVGLVVLAVAVGHPPRRKEAVLLVVAQRPGARARALRQLADPHGTDGKP